MDPISIRIIRLNNLVLGHCELQNESISKLRADAVNREALFDTLFTLYQECNKEYLQKKDKKVLDFVNTYRPVVDVISKLRININDFELKYLIGKGYFGDVYLSYEKATSDIYAIKRIRKSSALSAAEIKQERDILTYSKKTDWIISLQYAFQDNEYLYLVMEYLPGGDLLSLMIRYGAMSVDVARFYLAELTLAINAVHNIGFVHRDIKPENILLDRFGHLKLADFGNAALLNKDGKVLCLSPVGTPDYIAPELLDTLSENITETIHGVSCDYWSMGIIGYELVTETTPFHDDNVLDTYSKIKEYCNDNKLEYKLNYPNDLLIDNEYRNLINGLISPVAKRLKYDQIIKHNFFSSINWNNIRKQPPPIIPNIQSDDDISNFECSTTSDDNYHKILNKRKILSSNMTSSYGNEFTGQNLSYLGFSYINEEKINFFKINNFPTNKSNLQNNNDLESLLSDQLKHIKTLQEELLVSQRKNAQTVSLEKILLEAKSELNNMKEIIKQKTIELAECKTSVKTLQNTLRIEEEMRLKTDKNISEVLNATYQKWENAKKLTDHNYEKQISEKKTEIQFITQNLKRCEQELNEKVEQCNDLQNTIEKYKELIKTNKQQQIFERDSENQSKLSEQKLTLIQQELLEEKELTQNLSDQLKSMKTELNEINNLNGNLMKTKELINENLENLKIKFNQQIDENKLLRSDFDSCSREKNNLEKLYDENLLELATIRNQHRSSSVDNNSIGQFKSAQGSLESLTSTIEDQLRNDLMAAKENEIEQRKRADRLETVVVRLEEAIANFNSMNNHQHFDDRKNEKLEDQLASVREQAIIERQASRTAHLSLYKLEKQIEDLTVEKKRTDRLLQQTQDKCRDIKEEQLDLHRKLKELQNLNDFKDKTISELERNVHVVKEDRKKELEIWKNGEDERVKDKANIIENIFIINKLKEEVLEYQQDSVQLNAKLKQLTSDNETLKNELTTNRNQLKLSKAKQYEIDTELKQLNVTMESLKQVCLLTDKQFTELEAILETEQKTNKLLTDKNNELILIISKKSNEFIDLTKQLNEESAMLKFAETKLETLQTELSEKDLEIETLKITLHKNQNQIIDKTTDLFKSQEQYEILFSDLTNLQRLTSNYEQELFILKEENSTILTNLYLAKEQINKLLMEQKILIRERSELKLINQEQQTKMMEEKNFYLQRDIKSEATQEQYKKLIMYLQKRVEELTPKKSKTLMDVLFGSNTVKKERSNPVKSTTSTTSTNSRSIKSSIKNPEKTYDNRNTLTEPSTQNTPKICVNNHHLENKIRDLSLALTDSLTSLDNCYVCSKPINNGYIYLKCTDCNYIVHSVCKSDVGSSSIDFVDCLTKTEDSLSNDEQNSDVKIELLFKLNTHPTFNVIHCIYEILDSFFLLGCDTGLYSYHKEANKIVQINGLTCVNAIAVNAKVSKSIIIGDNCETLYQCDLKQLENRAQSSSYLQPKLDTCILDFSIVNRISNENWHFVKLHNNSNDLFDAIGIAAANRRFVILRFDITCGRFISVQSLDTDRAILSAIFTSRTVIIASNKFFELDLITQTAEELLQLADSSTSHLQNFTPMNIFKINEHEYLLCFKELGIFIDEFGCRSRPDDIIWSHGIPTNFIYVKQYQQLFISYFDKIEIIFITKSFSNALRNKVTTGTGGPGDGESGMNGPTDRNNILLSYHQPTLMTVCCTHSSVLVLLNELEVINVHVNKPLTYSPSFASVCSLTSTNESTSDNGSSI